MAKKILLIDPPFQKFMNFSKGGIPLGLLSLAGSLKNRGHEVDVLDSDYNPHGESYPFIAKIDHYKNYLDGLKDEGHPIWEGIKNQISESSPDIVGLSLISTKVKSGLRTAEIAKRLGVKYVFAGGPHVTISPESVSQYKNIDGLLTGEGENQFEELFLTDRVNATTIKKLDDLPISDRSSLVGIEGYVKEDLGYVMTARGCINDCNFCCSDVLWGRGVRKRNIDNVIKEIDSVNSNYGTTNFYVADDTFTLSKKRVMEFGDRMKERGYSWSCLTRLDRINEGMIDHMKNSGCHMVKVGVESGNERVLESMNKGVNLQTIRESSKLLNNAGMPWLAYFMAGSPGETSSDLSDTMKFIGEINPTYVSSAIYTPYPGTGFAKNHVISGDFALEEMNHHSLETIAGDIPREKLREFMEFSDKYNDSRKAREMFSK